MLCRGAVQVTKCTAQQYAKLGTAGNLTCCACPPGGNCTLPGTQQHDIVPLRGWWFPSGRVLVPTTGERGDTDTCPMTGSDLKFYSCPMPDSCLGGNESTQCNAALGYAPSLLCGTCKEGYVISKTGCQKCPDQGLGLVLFFGLLSGFVLWVWLGMSSFNQRLHLVVEDENPGDPSLLAWAAFSIHGPPYAPTCLLSLIILIDRFWCIPFAHMLHCPRAASVVQRR